jgi:sugar phosphate permease
MEKLKPKRYYQPIIKDRLVSLVCLGMFLAGFGFGAFLTWGPTFLRKVQNLEIVCASFIFSAFSIGGIVGASVLGYLSDKFGRRILNVIVGVLSGFLFSLLYTFTHPFLSLLALLTILGFIFQPFWNLLLTLAQESVNPDFIGTVTGVASSSAYVGSIISPLAVAALLSFTGLPEAMLICGAIPVFLYGLVLVCYKKR